MLIGLHLILVEKLDVKSILLVHLKVEEFQLLGLCTAC